MSPRRAGHTDAHLPHWSSGRSPALDGEGQHHHREHHYIMTGYNIPDIQPQGHTRRPQFCEAGSVPVTQDLGTLNLTPGLTNQERKDEETSEGHRMRMRRSRKDVVVQS